MKLSYWTEAKGIGGKIERPEDFVVREVISGKFLRKYSVGKDIARPEKYNLFLIKKKNLTTRAAIRILSEHLGIPEKAFGYAGLKDKFSVSYQYLTVKTNKEIEKINLENIDIIDVRKTDKFLSKGDLVGNEFEITLHGCRGSPDKAAEELGKGMPNFFGAQRFGRYDDNHIIGILLLRREFNKATEIIKSHDKKYKNIKNIQKDVLKFYIHAYQSWLFNQALDGYIKKEKKPYFKDVKMPGYKTMPGNSKIEKTMKELLVRDKITSKDFMINELRMSVSGAKRTAFIRVKIRFEKQEAETKLYFTLPKGSYATTVIREISKE
jgi:tRNA pseudouridine13 synthase